MWRPNRPLALGAPRLRNDLLNRVLHKTSDNRHPGIGLQCNSVTNITSLSDRLESFRLIIAFRAKRQKFPENCGSP
ncbi:hypothetical protein CJO78_23775 (plasmid) [Ralstonia solanacearum]|nr:hypothetical protein CJO78_23775 [Ralstonia solanacearum]AXW08714.1 hypothetical protein CJO82_23445 [Ralstonia solanacearum]AXW26498.1 hypothetical protein CJO86_23715 [Ralstonia solanacearum]AXW64578.1 hypothetical protein CJO94_23620 [Ralstonia solanacearum]AXW83414.1 hypothetical protein CJO98_23805 [Ralstonia solanacearum]